MRSSKVSVIQYEDEEPAKVEEVNIFIIVCVINSTNFVSSFPFKNSSGEQTLVSLIIIH